MQFKLRGLASASLLMLSSLALAQPSFAPDQTFAGSSLTGWHTLGGAKWQADTGAITGDGSTGNAPGWLFINQPYQDAGVYASFKCDGACDTGVLMRAEKSGDYTIGEFLAIHGDSIETSRVVIDSAGAIVERTSLPFGGGTNRYAPPLPDPAGPPPPPFSAPTTNPPPSDIALPIERPQRVLRKEGSNEMEVLIDADVLRAFFNRGGDYTSGATGELDNYGPFALYVGPGSKVEFHDLAWKDIGYKAVPVETTSPHFRMQRLSPFYYGWSAAAADFNRDGHLDIVSGPFIYFGPDFTRYREIYPEQAYNQSNEYSLNDWVVHAADFTGDGWPDILTTSHADGGRTGAVLYVNPKGESRRWRRYTVVTPVSSEESVLADVDGDGKPELVYVGGGYMSYAKPDPANPTGPWIVHHVSEQGPWPPHGIGVGDINGDGRIDILGAEGWWEQPVEGADHTPWKYHPVAFGDWGRTAPGGSVMGVYDVNGDGLNDVVTVLQAHGWGLAWFEQKRTPDGQISFVKHVIMDRTPADSAGGVVFTEPHGTAVADVDGDGIPDFIVGKRYWSHLDDFYDPDPYGAPVLYWYRTVRDPKAPGGARFVPELIDNRSGAGSDVLAVDLNGDGAVDIVTSTRSGTYIFWGIPKKQEK
jgi:hypothetical protein